MSDHSHISKQGNKSLDNRDAGKFPNVMYRTQRANAGDPDVGAEKSQEQLRLEDLKRAEEFEIHIENLKNEAIKQFDKELYEECLGTFRFLCELDPNNKVWRDYRELCEKLSGRTVPSSPKQRSNPSRTFPPASSLDGSIMGNTSARPLHADEVQGEEYEMQSRQSIAGHKPVRFEDSTPEELSDYGEILEIPDYDVRPSKRSYSNNRLDERMTIKVFLKSVLRICPRAYKIVLSIAGILALAAITEFPWRFHRRQDLSGPPPAQPIDLRSSQPPRGTDILPGQTEPSTVLQGKVKENKTYRPNVGPSDRKTVTDSDQPLKVDQQDKKARDLKTTSLRSMADQARELARAGKTAEAREIFSSLLEMARHEDSFPLSSQALEEEIKKLEEVSHPVIHDHFLGSCRGLLQFNSYTITYKPFGEPHHQFNSTLTEIQVGEPGGKLRVLVGRRTYRFEPEPGTSDEGKKQKLRVIYLELKGRGAKTVR